MQRGVRAGESVLDGALTETIDSGFTPEEARL